MNSPTVTFGLPGTIAGICRLVSSILIKSGQSGFRVYGVNISSSDGNVVVHTDELGCTVLTKTPKDVDIRQVLDTILIEDIDVLTSSMKSKFARIAISVSEYGGGLRSSGFVVHSTESLCRNLKLPSNSESSRLLLRESTFMGSHVYSTEDLPDGRLLILLSPSTESDNLNSVVKALTINIKE